MTVFVLRKKGGYFAAKARVKTRNFEECLGVRKTFTKVQESGAECVLPSLCLKATKNATAADALPLSIPRAFATPLKITTECSLG
jgi:hypothetical protein